MRVYSCAHTRTHVYIHTHIITLYEHSNVDWEKYSNDYRSMFLTLSVLPFHFLSCTNIHTHTHTSIYSFYLVRSFHCMPSFSNASSLFLPVFRCVYKCCSMGHRPLVLFMIVDIWHLNTFSSLNRHSSHTDTVISFIHWSVLPPIRSNSNCTECWVYIFFFLGL